MNDQENKELCDKALDTDYTLSVGEFIMGGLLDKIRENQSYQPQWDTFSEFLMELRSMKEGKVSKLMTIDRNIIKPYDIPLTDIAEVGVSNSYHVAKENFDEETTRTWLERGITASTKTFDISIKESLGKEVKFHEHDFKNRCKCGVEHE